jgi:hypothetical protein
MSATVEITIAEKYDILIIPAQAAKSEKWHTYVHVLENSDNATKSTQTEITPGITDGANIEVLSGLLLGQKIKIQTTANTNETKSTTRSSTNWFGGGGQPPF